MEVDALGIRVDSKDAKTAAADLDKLADAAKRAEKSTEQVEEKSKNASRAIKEMDKASRNSAAGLSNLAQMAGRAGYALGAALSIRKLQQYADAWSDMQSQVGAAIKNMEAAPAMMKRIVDISNASYSPLNQTVEVYTRNVAALKDIGLGAKAAADFTEALNHSLVITATKGEQAAAVQNALAKAMATGKLAGYELNTILTHGGRVAESLAKELGTTVNGLRQMAAEGKITSSVIANALLKSLEDVRKEAGEMPATIGDAFTRIQTNLTSLIGTLDKAAGVSAAIADKLLGFADNIKTVGDYILAFGHMAAPVFGALSEGLDTTAQYADYALVALAGFAVPYLLGGIATLTNGVWLLVTSLTSGLAGALKTITILLQANPLFRLGALLSAAAVAVYHFRDDIKEAIGVDVVDIAKNAANLVIGSFAAAYEDIKFVWNNFGDIMGAAFIGGVNIAIEAMNKLGGFIQSWMNKAIQMSNRIAGTKINNVSLSPFDLIDNPYAERLKRSLKERNAAVEAAMTKDYIGALGARWEAVKKASKVEDDLSAATTKSAKATQAATAASEAYSEWHKEAMKSADQNLQSILKTNASLTEQLKTMGMSKVELNNYKVAKLNAAAAAERHASAELEASAAILKAQDVLPEVVGTYEALAQARLKAAEALEQQATLTAEAFEKQEVIDAQKKREDDWIRFMGDIERSLTDALMRGFEAGDGFSKNFVNTLKNTLKTAALKIVVQAIVDPVMGGLQQLGGGVGGAAGKTGGLLSTGSSLMNLGSSSAAAAGLATQFAYSGIGASLGLSTAAGAGYAAPVYAAGGQLLSAGSTGVAAGGMTAGGSALASMASAAPYVLAGLAIADAVGLFGKRGGPQQGQYGELGAGGYSSSFTMSGGDALGNESLAKSAYAQAQTLFAMAGRNAAELVLQQGYKLDPQGTAAGVAYRNIIVDGQTLTGGTFDGNNGAQWRGGNADATGAATYLARLTSNEIQAIADALNDPKLNAVISNLKRDFSDLAEGMARYQGAQVIQKQMLAAVLTSEEAEKQRLADATEMLNTVLGNLGRAVPKTTDEFRALVEGIDLTTRAGQDMLGDLAAMGDAFIIVAEAAKAAAEQQREYADRLRVLQGEATELQIQRQQELASALTDANRAILEQVYALEDQQAAFEQFTALMNRLDVLQGLKTEQQIAREKELGDALDEVNRGILEQIYALEDQNLALEQQQQAQDAAYKALMSASDAAYAALQRAVAAQKKALEAQKAAATAARDVAREQVNAVQSVFDALETAIKRLYGAVDGGAMAAAQAQQFIDDALRAAQATGYLPDAGELAEAVSAVERSFIAENYSSAFELERARLVLAGKLSTLGDLSKDQLGSSKRGLAAAEDQLKALDAQVQALDSTLNVAQEQLDVLRGIDVSVLSVAEALDRFAAALKREAATPATPVLPAAPAIPPSASAALDLPSPAPSVTPPPASVPQAAPAPPVSESRAALDNILKTSLAADRFVTSRAGDLIAEFAASNYAIYLSRTGGSHQLSGASAYERLRETYGFARGGYHSGGIRLVGEEGPELEVTGPSRIYSAEQTRQMLNGGNNAEEIKELRKDMNLILARIENNTRSTADAVNGENRAPILVEVA